MKSLQGLMAFGALALLCWVFWPQSSAALLHEAYVPKVLGSPPTAIAVSHFTKNSQSGRGAAVEEFVEESDLPALAVAGDELHAEIHRIRLHAERVARDYFTIPGIGPEEHILLATECLNAFEKYGAEFSHNGEPLLKLLKEDGNWIYFLMIPVPPLPEFEEHDIASANLYLLYENGVADGKGFNAKGGLELEFNLTEESIPRLRKLNDEDTPISYCWDYWAIDKEFAASAKHVNLIENADGTFEADADNEIWQRPSYVSYPFLENLYQLNLRIIPIWRSIPKVD